LPVVPVTTAPGRLEENHFVGLPDLASETDRAFR
jgi:hypothetical protein